MNIRLSAANWTGPGRTIEVLPGLDPESQCKHNLHNIVKARGAVYGVAFSPDGRTLASASWQTIELWNPFTGEHIGTFTGHPGWNRAVAFSPDGQTLASGSDYGTVILWDMNQIPVPDQ